MSNQSNKNKFFDKYRKENFLKIFRSNIDKRLRELEYPSDVDCQRWIWELIQNAKDSIVGQEDRDGVDIEILVETNVEVLAKDIGVSKDDTEKKLEVDKYTFKHNGAPFIDRTLYGLIYKFSEGKSNNSESTGRFGTGFLTTHSLSKVVNISGDVISDGETHGFTITMYREGENEDLLKGLDKTENSFCLLEHQPFGLTSFEYIAKMDRNKYAGKLGIKNFKENISKVMLFCPEIHSIKLNDNGTNLTIKRGEPFKDPMEICERLPLYIDDGNNHFTKTFLYVKVEEYNKEFCKRFNDNNRKLKICCAIEIDNNNKIFVDQYSPCLFCTLPFVGSEKHELPFIINSPDFEPDSERQAIILEGNEFNEDGILSNAGINKLILRKAQKMFETLLEYISQNDNIKNRFLLTRGLCICPDKIEKFDHDWYEESFIKPMRNILIKYPIVWNGKTFVKITDIHLPWFKYEKYNNKKDVKKLAYESISKFYNNEVPTFEETLNFENNIWEDDNIIKYVTMEKCIQDLSKYNNINTLIEKSNINSEDVWKWMDDILSFIDKHHPSYLRDYIIIPNMKEDFVQLTNGFTTSKDVPDNMIECIEKLGIEWKSNHINKKIINYSPFEDHKINNVIFKIKDNFKEWSNKILILISYIPYDNEDEIFIQKRLTIYQLCSVLWDNSIPRCENNGNGFPKELWDGTDDIVFKELIRKIVNQKKLGGDFTIDYMKQFLECVSCYYSEFKNYLIVPNQNGKFCKINDLYKDDNIPSLFKENIKECFNEDIKDELIDKNLTSIESLDNERYKNISDYIDILNNCFKSEEQSRINKRKASRMLIRIIPKESETNIEEINDDWQNNQRKLIQVLKLKELKEIKSYVIEKYNDVESLVKYLGIEKSKYFEYMNVIINIFSCMNITGKVIPNQYEEFCELKKFENEYIKNNLYNEGIRNSDNDDIELISEEIKDIAKDLKYDVRKKLIHSNIKRIPDIPPITERDVNGKIAKIIEEINEKDIEKRSDPKFIKILDRLNVHNFKIMRKNPFNDNMLEIFNNVLISNISNRLRELENPSEEDCKRWIWELFQNAKDSIAGQEDRSSVNIIISVEKDDKYIFKHNGSPFTDKTLPALLYKYSKGKAENSESTGRFGTGFLTTHSLSKIVNISGDIISDGELKGFKVILNREGEKDEELLEGLKKTKSSYEEFPIESHQWTSFEYSAKNEKNKIAGRLGIQNFKENITKVMLFCPEIESVQLNDNVNGTNFEIKRNNDNNENIIGKCQTIIFNIKENNNCYTRTFIYIKKEEINKELSDRFNKEHYLRICCAIEIDDNNKIYVDPSSPCLFCALPLIGSEKHKLPFIINSPDFETNDERQYILLSGENTDEETNKISNPGINKMILEKAKDLYEDLLKYICKDNIIKDRYFLTRGLCVIPEENEINNFDCKWYKENVIKPMRNTLIKYPIIWNGQHYIEFSNIYLPNVSYYNIQYKEEAYTLISQFYNNEVPTFEETLNFENNIWKNDSIIKYITIEKCIQDLSKYKNINTLIEKSNINSEDVWKWMDDILLFIDKHHPSYLREYSIIPNMKEDFVQLTNDLTTSKDVPNNMIECIEELGIEWKLNHIHKKIDKFSFGIGHTIDDAVTKIHTSLATYSQCITLISYIPEDNENKKYVQRRQTIYELCSVVFNNLHLNKKNGNGFPEKLWNIIDEHIFNLLIKKIEAVGKLEGRYTIEFMKKFLECISQYYPNFRYYKIIPNKNGIFCRLDYLKEDKIIPLFKECMLNYSIYDINKELIDDILISIISFNNIPKKTMYDYIDKLNKYFESREIYEEKKEKVAESLIRIIPKISENNDINDWQDTQRMFFDIYKTFTKINEEGIEIDRNEKNKQLWKYVNLYIFEKIKTVIEKYNNIEELVKYLGIKKSVYFEYINIILRISSKGKIIPNQNENFCKIYELNSEEELIPEELKDVTKLKNIAKHLGYDIRSFLIHENVDKIDKLMYVQNKSYREICDKIDGLIKEKYDKYMEEKRHFPNIHPDPEFRTAANDLIEMYFDDIGDITAQKYFPWIYPHKDHIILSVILPKETRKNMTELVKNKDDHFLSKLLKNKRICEMINEGVIQDDSCMIKFLEEHGSYIFNNLVNCSEILKLVLNNELNDENIKHYINIKSSNMNSRLISEKYDDDTINAIINNPTVVNMVKSNKLSDKSLEYLINKETGEFKNINENSILISEKYDDDTINTILNNPKFVKMMRNDNFVDTYEYFYDFFNPNEITGYRGEAYIYEILEELHKSGQIKSVEWKTLSKNGQGRKLEFRGKTYYLILEGSHYDIVVETNNNRKIYIEVKTTSREYNGKKVPFFLSQKQIETMNTIAYPNEYFLAIVFDVNNYPKHFFMNLKYNIIKNKVCDNEDHQHIIELEKKYGEENIMKLLKNIENYNNL
ncbi:hypothetical protein BCR32DRAFT_289410 [Anaeromyces robustus]|uniref:Protein NO VEIN C-terminal domain-containing protein n=1 Tax=Anaeromyces robustus TaxID=1754192 RepID=A0A1Y1XNF1_9FUNG|nr:hypothetical protein BCR32DRAFT_289410 [Anaeromyces robustus]|eukprot:ORX87290.1 hypothetical protein BCR32DRAFT_289410 [Anaeromyces robustus]